MFLSIFVEEATKRITHNLFQHSLVTLDGPRPVLRGEQAIVLASYQQAVLSVVGGGTGSIEARGFSIGDKSAAKHVLDPVLDEKGAEPQFHTEVPIRSAICMPLEIGRGQLVVGLLGLKLSYGGLGVCSVLVLDY